MVDFDFAYIKSIHIRKDNEKILEIKRTKYGVICDALESITPLKITCVMKDNSRIIMYAGKE